MAMSKGDFKKIWGKVGRNWEVIFQEKLKEKVGRNIGKLNPPPLRAENDSSGGKKKKKAYFTYRQTDRL